MTTILGTLTAVSSLAGNDFTAARGDISRPYATLAAALATCVAGDSILVAPGLYQEAVVVPPGGSLTLRGLDPETTRIQPSAGAALSWAPTGNHALRVEGLTLASGPGAAALDASQGGTVANSATLILRDVRLVGGSVGLRCEMIGRVEALHCTGVAADEGGLGVQLENVASAALTDWTGSAYLTVDPGAPLGVCELRGGSFPVLAQGGACKVVSDASASIDSYDATQLEGPALLQTRATIGELLVTIAPGNSASFDLSCARVGSLVVTREESGGGAATVAARGAIIDTVALVNTTNSPLNLDIRSGSYGALTFDAGCCVDRDNDSISGLSVPSVASGGSGHVFRYRSAPIANVPPFPAGVPYVVSAQAMQPSTVAGEAVVASGHGDDRFTLVNSKSSVQTANVMLVRSR